MIVAPLGACATGGEKTDRRDAPRQANAADQALIALLDEQLRARNESNPIGAGRRGHREYDDELPDVSPEAIERRLNAARDRLRRLERIDRERLSERHRLNAELLEWELRDRLEQARFKPWQRPVNQLSGPHTSLPQLPRRLSFTKREHLSDYLERLRAVPGYIEQTIENMRAGVEAGRTPPKIVMRAAPEQVFSQATEAHLDDPTTHPMHEPFADLSSDDPLAQAARDAIREDVVPAFRRLGEFLRDEYIPECRESIAATDLPGGREFYAARLRHYTTTDLSAREIHEIGKREVARIRAEMTKTIARSDFPMKDSLSGDALFDAFVKYLRTDDRFYYETPEALLRGYRDICKRMDAHLPALFRTLPRLSYGVRKMPDYIATSAPTAYYQPGAIDTGVAGYFIANTHRLDQRPKYEMIALALHEAVPGHHFQIALAQELEAQGLHEWRTTLGYTAFVEGWALYAERLGLEVGGGEHGMYADPYDDFGRLTYEMWRALRLVVDTGMHAMGWSRDRAIDYMLDNSALTEQNVTSEVDRYIAWPGQATAYKIGQLRISDLRRRAEETLGEAFSVRAFHDRVLGAGALPLSALERRVEDWLAERRAEASDL